jgi:hypothetical protein
VPAALTFAILLAGSIARVGDALMWNADYVTPQLVAESIRADGMSETVLGTFGPYTTILFDVLTEDLPGHRRIWLVWPLLLALAGVALMARCSWRLAGPWAAAVTAAIGVCVSTPMLPIYVAPANRNALLFCQALLGAFLLAIGRGLPRRWAVAGAIAIGALVGASTASDTLVGIAGLAPFAIAAAVVAWLRRGAVARRVLTAAGLTVAVALAAWGLTNLIAKGLGFNALGATQETFPIATPAEMWENVERLVRNVMSFASGDVLGAPMNALWYPSIVAGVLALVAAAVPVWLAVALLRRAIRARRAAAAPPAEDPAQTGRTLYLLYWGLTVALGVAAFVGTNIANLADTGTVRYLVAVFFAIAATLPLWAGSRLNARALVGTGVALACALSAFALSKQEVAEGHELLPWAQMSDEVYALAASRGIDRGYASYGEASPLTWASGGALDVRPVLSCAFPDGRPTLCPFVAQAMADWYLPDPEGPSMLIVSPLVPFTLPPGPPAALGRPESVHRILTSTVYVYAGDVGRRFGNVGFPPPPG